MPQSEVVRLSAVVGGRLLEIPDYQRPYSWDRKQLSDLWEDLDLLGKSGTHYAGTLVLRRCIDAAGEPKQSMDDAGEVLEHYEVVDGQQRLTTCLILLDRIRRRLDMLAAAGDLRAGEIASGLRLRYGAVKVNGVCVPRLMLGSELNRYWKDHVLGDETYVGPPLLAGERRLRDAAAFFDQRISALQTGGSVGEFVERLLDLQRRVTSGLGFLLYEVQGLAEVGVIFETLNERGRPLTQLEKAKNYLLYLARRIPDGRSDERATRINDSWASIFRNISDEDDADDQLLRSHWLATIDPDRRRWFRISSIKQRFDRTKYASASTRIAPSPGADIDQEAAWSQMYDDVSHYVRTLRDCSFFLAEMFDEKASFDSFDEARRAEARNRGQALRRSGITAPYRPLLLAARLAYPNDGHLYCRLLDVAEKFSARAFVIEQRRTNTGEPALLQLAFKLYSGDLDSSAVVTKFEAVLWRCAPDHRVRATLESVDENWYSRRGHKYFLYEYERSLLGMGQQLPPLSSFTDRSGSTRTTEHILPQNPSPDANCWWDRFTYEEHARLQHALGNLVLTLDNSSYGNKCFDLKRGTALEPGSEPRQCYAQGKLHQERELIQYGEWTPDTIEARQRHFAHWALEHWSVNQPTTEAVIGVDDEDEIEPEVEDDLDQR
jgi:hypothetical protein